MYDFILVGPHAGKTVTLGGHAFVDGTFTLGLDADGVAPSPEDAERKGIYLGKMYQAFPKGSDNLAEAKKTGKSPLAKDELNVADAEIKDQAERIPVGEPSAPGKKKTVRKGAVRTAVVKLDPTNDEHWTDKGLPSVEAVRDLSKNDEISRQDIVEVAPSLTREEAAKIAAEKA
jgi:hypothetical protein